MGINYGEFVPLTSGTATRRNQRTSVSAAEDGRIVAIATGGLFERRTRGVDRAFTDFSDSLASCLLLAVHADAFARMSVGAAKRRHDLA